MMGNRARKILRAEHNPPINFTCGICMRVHEYKGSYDCVDIKEEIKENGDVQEE